MRRPPSHLVTLPYLSTNGLYCHFSLSCFGAYSLFAAGGEDLQSHVAAGFGPFVALLGQHGADEADDGVAAGRRSPRRRSGGGSPG